MAETDEILVFDATSLSNQNAFVPLELYCVIPVSNLNLKVTTSAKPAKNRTDIRRRKPVSESAARKIFYFGEINSRFLLLPSKLIPQRSR